MQTPKPLTKPSKQRKLIYEAPAHLRHKLLASHLSSELRAPHLIRSLPVRMGDTVRVIRGDHKNVEGKITRVDLTRYRIYVEGLTREKVDGTTIFVPIHPSKVIITHLNLDDKWRRNILERKKKAQKKVAEKPKTKRVKPEEKPAEEAEKVVEVVEEKPAEVIEKVEEIVKEEPIKKAKPARKVTRAKRAPTKKKAAEKTKTKTEAKAEKTEQEQQPQEMKKPKRTAKKSKKTEEGEA
jgi:large subunit ribosomal protein L24